MSILNRTGLVSRQKGPSDQSEGEEINATRRAKARAGKPTQASRFTGSIWLGQFLLAALTMISAVAPLRAAERTLTLSGSITSLPGLPAPPWDQVQIGDPFSVRYTYEDAIADTDPATDLGNYPAISSYTLTIGAATLSETVAPQNTFIRIFSNRPQGFDQYEVSIPVGGIGNLFLQLDDDQDRSFSSDALVDCGDLTLSNFSVKDMMFSQDFPGDEFIGDIEDISCDSFVEIPGVQEFTGQLTVRPIQVEEWIDRGFTLSEAETQLQAARDYLLGSTVITYVNATDESILSIPQGMTENELSLQFMAQGLFQYAEPNWLVYPMASPSDPEFGTQSHHVRMGSCSAWEKHTGFPRVTVAICDTGILTTHEDLLLHRKEGYNSVDREWEVSDGGDIGPIHPHGTLVAGAAAANGDNCVGIAGVGWNLSHRMVRVTNSIFGGATISVLTHGARTAIEAGDRVANASYSGVNASSVRTNATYIKSMNGLLVWAAGNSNRYFGRNRDDDDVIAVGATTTNDVKLGSSNHGPYVDVVAQGQGVYTTDFNGGYTFASGTSIAAPLVAGLAGLIWSADPTLTPDEVELILKVTCVDLGAIGVDDIYGYGRIDLDAAMTLVNGSPCGSPPSRMTGWWPMESASQTDDIAGFHTTSTIGAPISVEGKVGDALSFNGINQALSVQNTFPSLNLYSRFSADAWIRTTPCEPISPILDKRTFTGPEPRGFRFYLSDGKLAFSLADHLANGYTNYLTSEPDLRDGCWHLVAFTYDRSINELRLYVDSVEVGAFNTASEPGIPINSAPLLIGGGYPLVGPDPSTSFFGEIDEVEVFSKTLTQSEIGEIYAASKAGKCDFGCDAPSLSFCQPNQVWSSPVLRIRNFASTPSVGRLFEWEIDGEFDNVPIVFTPASGGPTLVSATGSLSIPFNVTWPTNMSTGDVAEYAVTVSLFGTDKKVRCKGTITKSGWTLSNLTNAVYSPLGPEGFQILIRNEAAGTGELTYQVRSINPDGSQDQRVVSFGGLRPGEPVIRRISIPQGGTATIDLALRLAKYELLQAPRVIVEADIDGDGILEILTSAQIVPEEPPLHIVHERGLASASNPFSGYIDPHLRRNDGGELGIDRTTLVFSRPAFDLGSTNEGTQPGMLTTNAFVIHETGNASPPQITAINTSDNQTVEVVLSRIITMREWTTLIAQVEDQDGNPIASFGSMGQNRDEPDRVDLAFLQGDINQDGRVGQGDIARLQTYVDGTSFPRGGGLLDYDINADGNLDAEDVADLARLLSGLGRLRQGNTTTREFSETENPDSAGQLQHRQARRSGLLRLMHDRP